MILRKKIGRGYAEFTYRLIIDAPAETVYVRFFTSQGRFIITITVVSHFCPTLSNFNAVLSKCAQSGLFCVNSAHCVNTPLNNAIEKDNLVLSTQLIILNYPTYVLPLLTSFIYLISDLLPFNFRVLFLFEYITCTFSAYLCPHVSPHPHPVCLPAYLPTYLVTYLTG